MKQYRKLDSIAWWFALNVAAAILASLLMSMIFVQLAGVWARPPLQDAGVIDRVAGIYQAMSAMPARDRIEVSRKLSASGFPVQWFASRERLPIPAGDGQLHDNTILQRLRGHTGNPRAQVLAMDDDDKGWSDLPDAARHKYIVAMELRDHSWLMFGADERTWGLGRSTRWLLSTVFILISSALIAGLASRRLAYPIRYFAHAAEAFGSGSHTQTLEVSGPREIREAANAFNTMQMRIRQLVDSRTEMLMAISHDLRAPLTRMRLRGEFIDDPEQQMKLFRDVDDMQAMIEASLQFFRQNGQDEDSTRFDLVELVRTVVDDFHDLGADVRNLGACPHAVCHGRPLALRRALGNVVDNAVKYGLRAEVSLHLEPRHVVIVVDDDGPGVAPALIPKLFQPFFRGEPSRNRATGGYGLGLASALSTVRAHGGTLDLENRKPHGLRATIRLALAPRLEPALAPRRRPGPDAAT